MTATLVLIALLVGILVVMSVMRTYKAAFTFDRPWQRELDHELTLHMVERSRARQDAVRAARAEWAVGAAERLRSERGMAFAMAMIFMALLSTLMAAFAIMGSTEMGIAQNHKLSSQAWYVAESGIETAKRLLVTTDFGTFYAGKPCPATLWQGSFVAGSVTSVTVKNADGSCGGPSAAYLIRSDGTVTLGPQAQAQASVTVQLTAPSPWRFGAVYGRAGVDISGGAVITGDVVSAGLVSVSGSTTSVSGKITNGSTLQFPRLDCPTGEYSSVLQSHGVRLGTDGSLNIAAGGNLTLTEGTWYFSSLVIAGNGSLTTVGAVQVYIDGVLNTSGGSVVNTTGAASNLLFKECGSPGADKKGIPIIPAWSVSGGSGAEFGIYAPDATVSLSGNSVIKGSVIGAQVTDSGGTPVQADASLGQVKWGTESFVAVLGTFHQQSN
jgi:hypothetical protein